MNTCDTSLPHIIWLHEFSLTTPYSPSRVVLDPPPNHHETRICCVCSVFMCHCVIDLAGVPEVIDQPCFSSNHRWRVALSIAALCLFAPSFDILAWVQSAQVHTWGGDPLFCFWRDAIRRGNTVLFVRPLFLRSKECRHSVHMAAQAVLGWKQSPLSPA